MQYQQQYIVPQYGYPAQAQQQYLEPAHGGGYGAYRTGPQMQYEQPMQYEQHEQPMQYERHPMQYEQAQYVQQAPQQAGGYYEHAAAPHQYQQQFAGPQLIQQQQLHGMPQSPPMPQQPQYAAAPQPPYQQPLVHGGRGKLVKAGRCVYLCICYTY